MWNISACTKTHSKTCNEGEKRLTIEKLITFLETGSYENIIDWACKK